MIFKSTFKPSLEFGVGEIADALAVVEKVTKTIPETKSNEEANKSLESKLDHFLVDGPSEPFTEVEAALFDERFKKLQENFDATLARLSNFKTMISEAVLKAKPDYVFHLEIERKSRVKRALRKLLGNDSPDIPYNVYVELMAAKNKLESEGLTDFRKGFQDELS